MQKFDKIVALCFVVPLLLDRLTKYFIVSDIWPQQTITSFFNIYLTHNVGIAWGIGQNLPSCQITWLNILIACILLYFIWYMRSILHNNKTLSACMLIVSGGCSNFFDRLYFGSVIDFIQLHLADWYFPVFNVADMSISLGAILLIYFIIFDEQ